MNSKIKFNLIPPSASILQAMKKINEAPKKGGVPGMAFVIDKKNQLLGIITDGDIRRAIIARKKLSTKVERVMTKKPMVVKKGLNNQQTLFHLQQLLRDNPKIPNKLINFFPVIDEKGKIDDVVHFFDVWKHAEVKTRNICVLGMGYVGVTLAVTLADLGFNVLGIDINPEVVATLKEGKPHIHEVGLDLLWKKNINKNLKVDTRIKDNLNDIYIITVGTPVKEDKKPHLEYVQKASKMVGKVLKKDDLVILRSTVPVGTSRNVALPVLEKYSGLSGGKDFYLSFAPERTVEGNALDELRTLPQVVGSINKESTHITANLFNEFVPQIVTVNSLEEAELVKLINNSYRDVRFAYANEVALICDKLNLDTVAIINAANFGYPRDKVPTPSPGVGGYCLSKDPYILADVAQKAGVNPAMILTGRKINEGMPRYIIQQIKKFSQKTNKPIRGMKVFVIGFAFKGKPETSDIRESSTLSVIKDLKGLKAKIYGYDPVVPPSEIKKCGVKPVSLQEGFNNADCAVVMNNHPSYPEDIVIDIALNKMKKPALFVDGWRMFLPEEIKKIPGIDYSNLGFDTI